MFYTLNSCITEIPQKCLIHHPRRGNDACSYVSPLQKFSLRQAIKKKSFNIFQILMKLRCKRNKKEKSIHIQIKYTQPGRKGYWDGQKSLTLFPFIKHQTY